ncbi:LexA family protein [Anaerococcus cruorum]|uniref:LexA family protein n=1 Tax=Anaerococcus sp. WGS1529 TaxID=3366812 RepID=UPI00372D294F
MNYKYIKTMKGANMNGSRLKQLRLERGYTQAQLADKVNLTPKAISFYEHEEREPDSQMLTQLANIFNVSVDYLIGKEENTAISKYEVPVYRAVSCGNPFIADEDIIDFEEISPKLRTQGDHFGLRLKGRSMEPRFNEGDVVIVRKQSDVDSGSIAIVRVNGDEATMKIVKKSPEGITLIATNPDVFLPQFYSNEQIENTPVEIIGKVIELRAKF